MSDAGPAKPNGADAAPPEKPSESTEPTPEEVAQRKTDAARRRNVWWWSERLRSQHYNGQALIEEGQARQSRANQLLAQLNRLQNAGRFKQVDRMIAELEEEYPEPKEDEFVDPSAPPAAPTDASPKGRRLTRAERRRAQRAGGPATRPLPPPQESP